jgi:membrane-bound lytic murein transglycosylase B
MKIAILFSAKTTRWLLVLLFIHVQLAHCAEKPFKEWMNSFTQEAIEKYGVSIKTANLVNSQVTLQPAVIRLDRSQPEFVNTFLKYYESHVSPTRVVNGRKKLKEYESLLNQLESQYGVSREILIAFWGMETNFGTYQGDIDTVSALATLAYEGRRSTFFKNQLIDVMRIIDQQQLPLNYLKGSWAGAFGHMQFMPSTFILHAVDGDANQSIDLKNSVPDALTSAANYISKVGWDMNTPTMIEVKLPEYFPYQYASIDMEKTIKQWSALGVVAIDAKLSDSAFARLSSQNKRAYDHQYVDKIIKFKPLTEAVDNQKMKAAIVLPQGWQGPAFMVFNNFNTIMDWNRSINYALSVTLLAQQLKDLTVLGVGKDADTGALSLLQMKRLQFMLNRLGFDSGSPDGYPGLQTQSAIRAYQLSQGLPADGYASPSIYYHLDEKMIVSNLK